MAIRKIKKERCDDIKLQAKVKINFHLALYSLKYVKM